MHVLTTARALLPTGEHISHEEFDLLTAKLRAACFAVVIQQQAAERAAAEALATLQFPTKGTLMSADRH